MDVVYGSEQGYKMALAKLYASFVIVGQEQGGGNADISSNNGHDFLRGYFNLQECPTDEVAGTWLSGDKIEGLTYMTWDANDPWVADTYYRAYYTIALCNEFLSHATESAVSGNANLQAYRAEARFLRALAYYYVLDLFGKGPFVDETMGVGSYTPECYTNAQLFTFIESELKAVAADGLMEPPAVEYGRASKAAAWALLAKLYLNSEVYGAGNHYTDCITYCKQIMNAGYSLEADYGKLFNADNDKRTNEIIFPFVVDAVNTVTWGATTPTFKCEFGKNIYIGNDVYINFGAVFLDCSRITIGNNVLIGPNVGMYSANHSLDPEERIQGALIGGRITIGDKAWIAGDVKIMAGVTIGEGAVIGCGSIVTHDIPPRVIAAGNPCRVIRQITEADKVGFVK